MILGANAGNGYNHLRPVVHLSSKTQITSSSTALEETGIPHTITQY
ncbi:hypothetical protein [uncultured Clostridium sp.]|nr:hypothetical protein [uncultured Clostridium sp.]